MTPDPDPASRATRPRPARSPRRCAAALLLLLAGAAPAPAQSPAPPADAGPPQYSVASWTVDEGVPANTILDVLQTSDGYLWLATYEGLVRFDGVRFTPLAPDAEGIESGNIWRLYEDVGGVLWAAATGGVVRLEKGRVSTYGPEHGLGTGSVRAVVRDAAGTLLAGTSRGVMALRDGRFQPLPLANGLVPPTVGALAADADGGVWIGTYAQGLLRYRDGRYTRFGTADGLPNDRVHTLLRDPDGTLWVGTAGVGLVRVRDGDLERVPSAGAEPLRLQEIVRDRDGTLWVGADNGLFRFRAGRLEEVRGRDGAPFSLITGLHADQEGSLWVSTHRAGLFHVQPATVTALPTGGPGPAPVVYAIGGDGAGGEWIAARNGLTHRAPGGSRHFSRANSGLRDDVVRDLLVDRDGDLWLATFGGLSRLRDGRITTLTTADGLADDLARTLLEDRDGGLWVGSFHGLSYLRDGRFRVFDEGDGLLDRYVLALHQDRAGAVWVSTQTAGLLRHRDGRLESPPEVAALVGAPVFRLREDADGTLWIGSTRGLVRLRRGKLSRVTQAHGLPTNTVFQVLEDDLGYFWLSTNHGVVRVARSEVEAVADGRAERVQAWLFGRSDGLPSHDVTAVSRAWRAPDGTLWFPTQAGIARIDPHALDLSRRPPPVQLEGLRVNGAPVDLPGGAPVRLGPGVRRLDFDYTALSFSDPAQVRFRYRLEGFDEEWMDAGGQRSVSYTNLAPGRYRFRVIASNADGVWNTEGASLAFRVRPYFYQTAWFAALAVLTAVSGAAGMHRLRLRQVLRAEQDAEREASRQRMHRILESVTDSFVALDAGWRMTYVNGAAEQAVGRPRDELLGRSCWEAFPDAEGTAIEAELRRAGEAQVPAVFETPVGASGRRWMEFRAYPTPEGMSVYFTDVTERKEAEEALRSLSMRDPLTGLFNRRGLLVRAEQQVRHARETGHGFHVVFLDMDGMKAINDTFGHAAGDRALTDVAALLRRTFRDGDVLARIGGDEFAVLVPGPEGAEFDRIPARLHRAVEAHNARADRPYALRLSIGTSRFDPSRPVSIEDLIGAADREMYTEKRTKGRGKGMEL